MKNPFPGSHIVHKKRKLFLGLLNACTSSDASPSRISSPVLEFPLIDLSSSVVNYDTQDLSFGQGRLTHIQEMLIWNPFPLQSSEVAFEYLLLPPRSALDTILQLVAQVVSRLSPYLSTHLLQYHTSSGWVSVAYFSAFSFRGWFIRQVSCYTFLGGFQLPWPPSCC